MSVTQLAKTVVIEKSPRYATKKSATSSYQRRPAEKTATTASATKKVMAASQKTSTG